MSVPSQASRRSRANTTDCVRARPGLLEIRLTEQTVHGAMQVSLDQMRAAFGWEGRGGSPRMTLQLPDGRYVRRTLLGETVMTFNNCIGSPIRFPVHAAWRKNILQALGASEGDTLVLTERATGPPGPQGAPRPEGQPIVARVTVLRGRDKLLSQVRPRRRGPPRCRGRLPRPRPQFEIRCANFRADAVAFLHATLAHFQRLDDHDALDAVLAALCGDRPPASLLALRHQLVVAGADSRVLVPYLARCRDMSPDELAGQFQRVVDLVYADRDPVGLLNLLTSPAA